MPPPVPAADPVVLPAGINGSMGYLTPVVIHTAVNTDTSYINDADCAYDKDPNKVLSSNIYTQYEVPETSEHLDHSHVCKDLQTKICDVSADEGGLKKLNIPVSMDFQTDFYNQDIEKSPEKSQTSLSAHSADDSKTLDLIEEVLPDPCLSDTLQEDAMQCLANQATSKGQGESAPLSLSSGDHNPIDNDKIGDSVKRQL